jgi:hypothetical protein
MATDDPLQTPETVDDEELDALFQARPEGFVPARDALAKRLRGEDRAAADWVKGLRKPTLAAWGVNQLSRREPERLAELLEAADSLREAQDRLTAGEGSADELRRRSHQGEAAVHDLTEAARGLLAERESGATEQVIERIRDTLKAVSLDDQARRLVERGRLTREVQAAGFGPLTATSAGPRASRAKAPSASPRPDRRDERRVRRAEQAVEEAKDRRRQAEEQRQEADRAVKAATRELDRAQRRLDEAGRRLDQATSRERDSVDRLREAREARDSS